MAKLEDGAYYWVRFKPSETTPNPRWRVAEYHRYCDCEDHAVEDEWFFCGSEYALSGVALEIGSKLQPPS